MCYDVSLKTKNHQLRELLPDLHSEWTDEELESWPIYTILRSKTFSGTRPDGLGPSAPYHWPGLPDLGNDKPVELGSLF